MKRLFILHFFVFLILGCTFVSAQRVSQLDDNERTYGNTLTDQDMQDRAHQDSTISEIDARTIPIDLYMWQVDDLLGNINYVPVDTLYHHFQNENLTDGPNGEYNFLGNLGSPRQSRIFFNRTDFSQFLFSEPYSAFMVKPNQLKFTNTKSPFTNLSYHKGGDKRYGEERFKSYFSVNANKKLGVGFNIDYWYGRGMYTNQSTSLFNGSLFGSYNSDRYNLHTIFSYNQIKAAENGGIADDRYITDPLEMSGSKKEYNSYDIPVNLSQTWNENKNFYAFLTHRYNLGFDREIVDTTSTEKTEFIPITSFIHTIHMQSNSRRYISYDKTQHNYYANNYFTNDSTNDITKNLSIKNTFGISLREGFSKWAKAGLTAFITHEFRNFTIPDSIVSNRYEFEKKYTENVISVGGEFSKRQGRILHYNVTGDAALVGEDIGQFNLRGNLDLNFQLFKDTVRLDAYAFIKNTNPSFYYRHYHSKRLWWDNDLDKEFRTRVEGKLSIDRWRTQLKAGVENIKNYTYFRNDAVAVVNTNETVSYKNNLSVQQASDNIQVFSATLKQDFKLGIFHLDNEITYQKSSNNTILPVPELNLYHNFYISTKLAKRVLSVELGADVRYFSKYYASSYSPAIGQFVQQNQKDLIQIGGYPFVNVYLNVHLKRTRFYVMMSHINQGSGDSNYFLAPHYPVNPSMFRLGLSWNFFD